MACQHYRWHTNHCRCHANRYRWHVNITDGISNITDVIPTITDVMPTITDGMPIITDGMLYICLDCYSDTNRIAIFVSHMRLFYMIINIFMSHDHMNVRQIQNGNMYDAACMIHVVGR